MQVNWILAAVVSAFLVGSQGVGPLPLSTRPGTGFILGRVVDAMSGTPVSGVLVTLGGMAAPAAGFSERSAQPPVVLTDAQGRFVFRGLGKGSYRLTATIGGNGFSPSGFLVTGLGNQIGAYLNGGYGQLRPNGPTSAIDLAEGERVGDAVIRLWKGAAIEGAVLDEAGDPIVGAAIAAVRRSSDGRLLTGPTTKTDDRGMYRLGTLAPGEYVVVVPQTQVLMPASTIEAALASESTALVGAGASRSAPAIWSANSLREGETLVSTSAPPAATNMFAPVSLASRSFVYQTTFHPAASAASEAAAVGLSTGQTKTGVDVRLQPVAAVEVSGTVQDSDGPAPNFPVRLVPAETGDGASVLEAATTVTDGRGTFRFPLVPAGNYRLISLRSTTVAGPGRAGASPPPPPRNVAEQNGAWATQAVAVGDQNVEGIVLTLRPGVQISGRVEFRGTGPRPDANRLRELSVLALPLDMTSRSTSSSLPGLRGAMDANGGFSIRGVPAGRYVLGVQKAFVEIMMGGWTLSSITVADRDITDKAVEISGADVTDVAVTFEDQAPRLTGTVRNGRGAADSAAAVFVFPTDRSTWSDARAAEANSAGSFPSWILRTVRVSRTGTFAVTNLIPGEYFVVAASDAIAADWPDPRFLARLADVATTVRVVASGKAAIALRTADLR